MDMAKQSKEAREIVTCRIAPEIVVELDSIALAEARTRSQVIEIASREFVARYNRKGVKPNGRKAAK